MIQVAAFDLDGTVLDGESPFILTKRLLRERELPLHKACAMALWGIRYRLRLPQVESTPRELLFSCLTQPTVEQVDSEIMEIYEKKIRKCIRPGAIQEIQRCHTLGMQVILASASFKPITTAICAELGFDGSVSTIMQERDGHYTGRVLGVPSQGPEKLRLLVQYCNDHYGIDNWVLARAYSDHFSDIPLLEHAVCAYVTNPDGFLERVAKRNNWPIVDWDKSRTEKIKEHIEHHEHKGTKNSKKNDEEHN